MKNEKWRTGYIIKEDEVNSDCVSLFTSHFSTVFTVV
ncbi:MAG: hypothetical protein FMNOHCHN_01975 [Ignavibacteriaceae bacterium]|nr:hypothetical protein [Ignavibacteriaceae bacterium]